MKYKVFLGLGSNIGDRKETLCNALRLLSEIPDTEIVRCSNIYETEPVGYTEQDPFLNMAVFVMTFMQPCEFLRELQTIEARLKRVREMRWGPRTIDIDILLFGDLKINDEELTIPHPRMLQRAFVLIPFREIYPEKMIAGMPLEDAINQCEDKNGVKLYE